jgi:hypothetical protein
MRSNSVGRASYAVVFLAAAAVAWLGVAVPWDRAVARALAPLGTHAPWINLVWVVGGVPVTGMAAIVGSLVTRRWRWLGLWVAGAALEVAVKHVIHTPLPRATPEPLWLSRLEYLSNPSPHSVLHAVERWLHVRQRAGGTPLFDGSFFSGHVFRLTFTLGMVWPKRRWVPWATAGAATVMVLSTGGHWLVDAVGAAALAGLFLSLARGRAR